MWASTSARVKVVSELGDMEDGSLRFGRGKE